MYSAFRGIPTAGSIRVIWGREVFHATLLDLDIGLLGVLGVTAGLYIRALDLCVLNPTFLPPWTPSALRLRVCVTPAVWGTWPFRGLG
jgi:hypothetical protein